MTISLWLLREILNKTGLLIPVNKERQQNKLALLSFVSGIFYKCTNLKILTHCEIENGLHFLSKAREEAQGRHETPSPRLRITEKGLGGILSELEQDRRASIRDAGSTRPERMLPQVQVSKAEGRVLF